MASYGTHKLLQYPYYEDAEAMDAHTAERRHPTMAEEVAAFPAYGGAETQKKRKQKNQRSAWASSCRMF